MIKLDDNLLAELGLGALSKEDKAAFLKHMYETLEMRVGTRLAERMSDQQMTEFEQFINNNDEQGAFKWLESNFPNYKDVVAEEFEKLKNEVRPLASQIVAASHQQAAQPAPGVPAGMPPPAYPGQPQPMTAGGYYNAQPIQQPFVPPQPGQPAAVPSPTPQFNYSTSTNTPSYGIPHQQPTYAPPSPFANNGSPVPAAPVPGPMPPTGQNGHNPLPPPTQQSHQLPHHQPVHPDPYGASGASSFDDRPQVAQQPSLSHPQDSQVQDTPYQPQQPPAQQSQQSDSADILQPPFGSQNGQQNSQNPQEDQDSQSSQQKAA